MIVMLVKPQSYILYLFYFTFFNKSTKFFKRQKSFQNIWSKNFCRDQVLSFFHRFLNVKFSNRFNFTWSLFEKHVIIYYSVFPCYISTGKI